MTNRLRGWIGRMRGPIAAPVLTLASCAAGLLLAGASDAFADEGMWLLTKPPTAQLKSRHGFEPTPAWLEAMQKSAVRFNAGGSGSMVSATGLVMTNHHVASESIQKLSTPERNLLRDGYHAKNAGEELKCPDIELNVLWSIEDVTDKVKGAGAGAANSADAEAARRKAISEIEKTSQDSTGLQSQVVTLFQGGQYHLYRYKRFTDVRLVFAPEESIAFFGGDADNFEYPRFNLDVTFFRVYENDKPLVPEHYLKWSSAGTTEQELIFVFGHPGRTSRAFTVDHLKSVRDHDLPGSLSRMWRAEIKSQTFAGRGAENARTVRDDLFGIANSRKAMTGQQEGLLDPRLFEVKQAAEQSLRSMVQSNPTSAEKWGGAWDAIAQSRKIQQQISTRYGIARGGWAGGSELVGMASEIVRLADELPKPSNERLREFGDARLPSVYLGLYSTAPIYDALEQSRLASGLSAAAERLGADDPMVKTLLGGKPPATRAAELLASTAIKDPALRKRLVEGGKAALAEAMKSDKLLELVTSIDPEYRSLRKISEDQVEAVERENYAKIAAARFQQSGDSVYPDATFTLRMSYGTVKSFVEGGEAIPAYTNFAGLYQRFDQRKGQEGFALPARWTDAKGKLKLDVPFNFICTADIIGGNSGSPVVNKSGELVGIIFDGNLSSLVADYIYNDTTGRAVAVDSRGIIEALRSVYGAEDLVRELTTR